MNNENSNNDLNSISLGSVGNLGTPPNLTNDNSGIETLNTSITPMPTPPLEPIPPVNSIPEPNGQNTIANNGIIESAPIANSPMNEPISPNSDSTPNANGTINDGMISQIPPVEPIPPLDPVAPIYDVAETINSFNSAPVFNDIGTVPPISNIPIPQEPMIADPSPANDKKKKNGADKLLFVIIVILVLTAVGVGVYIFLSLSNNATSGVIPKNIKLEVGSDISTDIKDYASFAGVNSSSCELDTTKITNTDTLGAEYPFTIKCNGKNYGGTVTIVDTVAPLVDLKELTVGINEEIKADNFIDSCTDKTKCTYEFKDEATVKSYLSNTGNYTVDIIVKDEGGNTTEVKANLIVDGAAANLYLICTKNSNEYAESTKLGLADSTFIKTATRTYTFTLNETNYMEFKNENTGKTEIEYNGISGTFTLDDATRSIIISKKLTYEELTAEAGTEIPLDYKELKTFYQGKGYNCRLGQ